MENSGFRKILLATDGSEQAEAACRVAAMFAHASSAETQVVNVWSLEPRVRKGVWDIVTRSEAEALLTGTISWLRTYGVKADGLLVCADMNHVASALARAAEDFEADLVVVGSRGLSDWQSLVKHSVSHHLLTAVDCPMLIVRGKPAGDLHDAQKVLLAVAGGDDVAPGVRAAAAAASAPGSKVLVLHVAQTIFGAQGFTYVEPAEEIRETVRRATQMLQDAGMNVDALAAGPGHVADVVAQAAARWGADVIVIGSARMGDVGSIVLGSVTHDLLRATDRPVLVAERIGN